MLQKVSGRNHYAKFSWVVVIAMVSSLLLSTAFTTPQTAQAIVGDSFTNASNKAYDWLKARQDVVGNGLVDSFEDYYGPNLPVQIMYTYDQAVATIAFLLKGDTVRAKKVLDTLQTIQSPDGSWVNSYWWNLYGEELRKHIGPIMWVALAVMSYEKITGDTTTYHPMALRAIDWCLQFQKPNGALSGGMTTWDSGNGNWTPEVWSSTEQNEDAYAALLYFAQTTPSKAATYTAVATNIKSFLDNVVWDSTRNRWYGGFKNNTGLVDPFVPMDINPWGVLALGPTGTHNYADSINYVETANSNGVGTLNNPRYVQSLTDASTGLVIEAYDFDWQSDGASALPANGGGTFGPDIWFEGSAFMSEAYYLLGNTAKADAILNNIIKKQEANGGIAYSLYGTNNNYWKMLQQKCVSSTGWLILAIARWNPFTGAVISGGSAINPPTNLTADPPTTNSVNLSWTASISEEVTAYDIYNGTDLAGSVASTVTTYNVTSLVSGTNYTFTVKARNADGRTSLASNSVRITTDGLPPLYPPTNLAAGTPTSSSVNLTWTASTSNDVTAYDIYNDADLVGSVSGTTTTYNVTGLTAKTSYTFTVKARNSSDSSAASNAVTVTTAAVGSSCNSPGPAYTCGVTVVSDTQVKVWFKPTTSANVVDIHYNANNIGQQNFRMTNTAGTWEQIVTLSNGSLTYSFTYITAGVGATTPTFTYTGDNNGTTLNPPTNLAAGTLTSSSVNLTWMASTSSGVIAYDVYNGADLAGSVTGTSYNVTGLIASTSYTFTVKARNSSDSSAASNAVTITTSGDDNGGGNCNSPGPNYTCGVTVVSGTQVKVWFKPTTSANIVDIHYNANNIGQQNFRMTNTAGTWEQIVTLSNGSLTYSFTYIIAGVGADTPTFSFTR